MMNILVVMGNMLKFDDSTIKIGFTGTQLGMSENQKNKFEEIISNFFDKYKKIEFHHGDCIGADKQAHEELSKFYYYCFTIIIHPPKIPTKRAFCDGNVILDTKDYIQRNHDIVDNTEILIVAPKTNKEELRSGTWSTYRYAKKKKKEIIVLKRY